MKYQRSRNGRGHENGGHIQFWSRMLFAGFFLLWSNDPIIEVVVWA